MAQEGAIVIDGSWVYYYSGIVSKKELLNRPRLVMHDDPGATGFWIVPAELYEQIEQDVMSALSTLRGE